MIERIFSNLKTDQPVERSHTKSGLFDEAGNQNIWLRVERQTLRRMSESGDILFTIKICMDPFTTLQNHPDGAHLAAKMQEQIEALDADETAYKGLSEQRDGVLAELSRLAT